MFVNIFCAQDMHNFTNTLQSVARKLSAMITSLLPLYLSGDLYVLIDSSVLNYIDLLVSCLLGFIYNLCAK